MAKGVVRHFPFISNNFLKILTIFELHKSLVIHTLRRTRIYEHDTRLVTKRQTRFFFSAHSVLNKSPPPLFFLACKEASTSKKLKQCLETQMILFLNLKNSCQSNWTRRADVSWTFLMGVTMNIPWSALTKLVAGNHIIPIKMTWGYRQDAFSWSAWRFYEIRRVTLLILR